MSTNNRRQLLQLAALGALPLSALGNPGEARRFAVLSLVGESMTIVSFKPQTGSHLDQNERELIKLPEPTIDQAVLLAAEKELQGLQVKGEIQLVLPGGPQHYAGQEKLVDDDNFKPNAALEAAIKQLSATHLLVLTRARTSGGLRGVRVPSGVRTLEGLGFYLDPAWREKSGNVLTVSSGMLAPYAHARIALVDLRSRKVLKQELISASRLLPTPAGHRDPWVAVSDEVKMRALEDLLAQELKRVLPKLLEGA